MITKTLLKDYRLVMLQPEKPMTEKQYLWAYIHYLEDWLKNLSIRISELEANAKVSTDSSEPEK